MAQRWRSVCLMTGTEIKRSRTNVLASVELKQVSKSSSWFPIGSICGLYLLCYWRNSSLINDGKDSTLHLLSVFSNRIYLRHIIQACEAAFSSFLAASELLLQLTMQKSLGFQHISSILWRFPRWVSWDMDIGILTLSVQCQLLKVMAGSWDDPAQLYMHDNQFF